MSRLADSEEFARLYATHSRRIVAFFARRTYDAQVALDLTAETLAQAYSGRRRFRGESDAELLSWLFTIANRQLARYWRRGRAEQRAVRHLGLQVRVLSDDDAARIIELSGLADLRAPLDPSRHFGAGFGTQLALKVPALRGDRQPSCPGPWTAARVHFSPCSYGTSTPLAQAQRPTSKPLIDDSPSSSPGRPSP